MAENDDKSIVGLNKHIADLNQNAGLQTIHSKKIADLTVKRNQMAAKASGLSEKQAGRRQDYETNMKASQNRQEEAIKAGGKNAPIALAEGRLQKKMQRKEARALAFQQFTSLQGIKDGLGNLAKSMGGRMKSGAKLAAKGIGVLMLFALIQTDTFKNAVKLLVGFISDFIGIFTGETELTMAQTTMILGAAVAAAIFFLVKMGASIKTSMLSFGTNYDTVFGKKGALKKHAGKLKSMASSAYTKVVDALGIAFKFLFGKTGFLRATMIPRLGAMAASLMAGAIPMLASMGVAFMGMLSSFGAMLVPLLPFIAIGAAIAAIAYVIVRIFQGFMESFSGANEQFGFFGGILAGFTSGIKMILQDVMGIIDSIFGFFGFPDLMDPIMKAIDDFDVMNFVGGIMDFFADIGAFITDGLASIGLLFKAIGAGALAAIKSPFSPIESFNKAFDEVMSSGSEGSDSEPNLANIAKAGSGMSGGEDDPAGLVAKKQNEDMQMKRKEEMMDDKRAVQINNNNVVNKGGDSYSETRGGDVNVHDQSGPAGALFAQH